MSPELAARAWTKERREYLPNSPERDWKSTERLSISTSACLLDGILRSRRIRRKA